jgi:tetratricopeptide (TPR) repeat protein
MRRATGARVAGEIEQIAGDPAAAEQHLREAYEAYRAMGERGFLCTVAGLLAARWRAARAEVLARVGQFPAAQALLDEASALVSPTCWASLQAQVLLARAEVDRLAGTPERAAASLRAALRIYRDRHAAPLVEQATAALAGLAATPTPAPSRPERPGDKRPGMSDLRAAKRLTEAAAARTESAGTRRTSIPITLSDCGPSAASAQPPSRRSGGRRGLHVAPERMSGVLGCPVALGDLGLVSGRRGSAEERGGKGAGRRRRLTLTAARQATGESVADRT